MRDESGYFVRGILLWWLHGTMDLALWKGDFGDNSRIQLRHMTGESGR